MCAQHIFVVFTLATRRGSPGDFPEGTARQIHSDGECRVSRKIERRVGGQRREKGEYRSFPPAKIVNRPTRSDARQQIENPHS